MCFYLSQRVLQSGGGGGEAGRPDRVPETAQHIAEQEAAQPHCSALTTVGPPPPPPCEPATTLLAQLFEHSALLTERRAHLLV